MYYKWNEAKVAFKYWSKNIKIYVNSDKASNKSARDKIHKKMCDECDLVSNES